MKTKLFFMAFLVLMVAVPLQSAHAVDYLGIDTYPKWRDCDGVQHTAHIIGRAEEGSKTMKVYFSNFPLTIETKKDGNCVELERESKISFTVKKYKDWNHKTSKAVILASDSATHYSWDTGFKFSEGSDYRFTAHATYSDGTYQETVKKEHRTRY